MKNFENLSFKAPYHRKTSISYAAKAKVVPNLERSYIYRNYLNRSRPCIILDSKIPRLVLEAFPKVLFFGQFFLDQTIQKVSNKLNLMHL